MMEFEELPTQTPENLARLVLMAEDRVTTRTIVNDEHMVCELIALPGGVELAPHIYRGDTLFLVLEGQADLSYPDHAERMEQGDAIEVRAGEACVVAGACGSPVKLLRMTIH